MRGDVVVESGGEREARARGEEALADRGDVGEGLAARGAGAVGVADLLGGCDLLRGWGLSGRRVEVVDGESAEGVFGGCGA